MGARFLQFHFLTSYPSALLNRDDAGFAKRIPFGGVTRTRISSQCLKRHWRTFDGEHSLSKLEAPQTIRSRLTFDRFILGPLKDDGVDGELARAVTEALMVEVLGQSAKAKKAKKKKEEEDSSNDSDLQTGQITVLGRPEIDYLLSEAGRICKDLSDPKKAEKAVKGTFDRDGLKNLARLSAGLGVALFGRMVTSDILARGDAAMHVAHAFTVHAESAESDYFSAVDDLLQEGDDEKLGSGHIGSTELTSGLYYGYVVIDVPLLISNLEGCEQEDWESADRDLAAQVVERVPYLIATVSPGAKLGSTAPYAYAHFVLGEAGSAQPRTLANAFLEPVRERPNLLANTYLSLTNHLSSLDTMYRNGVSRMLSAQNTDEDLCAAVGVEQAVSLPDLARWAADMVRE